MTHLKPILFIFILLTHSLTSFSDQGREPAPKRAKLEVEEAEVQQAEVQQAEEHPIPELHSFALNGDLKKVMEILSENPSSLHEIDHRGWTALHHAALTNQVEVVKELLRRGANVNALSLKMQSPLHVTTAQGFLETARHLVEAGAAVNAQDFRGHTPLFVASEKGHLPLVRFLLEKHCEIDKRSHKGWTPLLIATRHEQVEVVILLLQFGASLETLTNNQHSAFHIAAQHGPEPLMAHLIQVANERKLPEEAVPAIINKPTSREVTLTINPEADNQVKIISPLGTTPLMIAAYKGRVDALKQLLEAGAHSLYSDVSGRTALTLAKRAKTEGRPGADEIIKLLTAHSYDPSCPSVGEEPCRSLKDAVSRGHNNCAKHMIACKTPVDEAIQFGEAPQSVGTSLTTAASCGNTTMAKLLLDNGAHPDGTPHEMYDNQAKIVILNQNSNIQWQHPEHHLLSPLVEAASAGHNDMVRLLCERKAQPNLKSQEYLPGEAEAYAMTPLIAAARKGHLDCVKTLIEFDASLDEKDSRGQTAAEVAQAELNKVTSFLKLNRNSAQASNGSSGSSSAAAALAPQAYPSRKAAQTLQSNLRKVLGTLNWTLNSGRKRYDLRSARLEPATKR